MSGSSGGFSFSSSSQNKDCSSILIKTHLASPIPDVLSDLNLGDMLTVSVRTATGPVVASTYDGDVAGSILTSDPGFLIGCLNQGFTYNAHVISLSGGDCQVEIYCTGTP